jgi:hypothetical protein
MEILEYADGSSPPRYAASGDAIRATARLEQAAPLTARFARHSFLRGLRPAGRALAAPLSAPPRGFPSLPRSLSGRFGAGALRPVLGCNGVFALR